MLSVLNNFKNYIFIMSVLHGNVSKSLCLQDHLTELLDVCAHMLERAERYELLGEIYRLIIPIFERKRDFEVRCFLWFNHFLCCHQSIRLLPRPVTSRVCLCV